MSLKNFETYELFMLISPDIPSQGVKSIFKKVLDYSCKSGGSVKKFEYLGQRKLAYKIGKYSRARCYVMHFQAKPFNIPSLTSYLKINDGIVRSLITIANDIPDGPSFLKLEYNESGQQNDTDYAKVVDGFNG